MYNGAEFLELRGRLRMLWGVDGTADDGRRLREETDLFGNRDGEGR